MDKKQNPKLDPSFIDSHAKEIVRRLQDEGFKAFLVGGCVRDILAGLKPKDFDIATNAQPPQVKRKIPGSYVIGKRFRLVLVKRGITQFEVATFRREAKNEELVEGETPFGDNFFGTEEEDAKRRDFTINAMFYDPIRQNLVDYCGGLEDIENRMIRIIGDPDTRLCEDPIRILRALRLAHKLNFSIEPSLRLSMQKNAGMLAKSVLPRRREEFLKILRLSEPAVTFHELHDLGILATISPRLHSLLDSREKGDAFDSYLQQIRRFSIDDANPLYLFGALVLAWARAENISEVEDSDECLKMMRDELGMFKHEQSSIIKALQLEHSLKQIDAFERRGARRKLGFLKNEAFPLALHIAELDYQLRPEEVKYWKDTYLKLKPQLSSIRYSEISEADEKLSDDTETQPTE
ncbi:MAG: CCA tRNA nucleotidyltransferase [Pseudobdellovibrionaceae bacterium]